MPTYRRFPLLMLAFAWLLGCSSPEGLEISASEQSVVGGSEAGVFGESVVVVRSPSGFCSGTVVGRRVVLTARHCLCATNREISNSGFQCDFQGNLVWAGTPLGGKCVPQDVAQLEIHSSVESDTPLARGLQGYHTAASSFCREDIAFLVVDNDLLLPKAKIRLGYPEVKRGEPVTIVGFGEVDDDRTLMGKRQLAAQVEQVGALSPEEDSLGSPLQTFRLGPSACSGDSGGPAFSASGEIVGVYSTSLGPCTTATNFFTMTLPFGSLATTAFDAAGEKPLVDRHLDLGEPCSFDDQCVDGLCINTACAHPNPSEPPIQRPSGGGGEAGADSGEVGPYHVNHESRASSCSASPPSADMSGSSWAAGAALAILLALVRRQVVTQRSL